MRQCWSATLARPRHGRGRRLLRLRPRSPRGLRRGAWRPLILGLDPNVLLDLDTHGASLLDGEIVEAVRARHNRSGGARRHHRGVADPGYALRSAAADTYQIQTEHDRVTGRRVVEMIFAADSPAISCSKKRCGLHPCRDAAHRSTEDLLRRRADRPRAPESCRGACSPAYLSGRPRSRPTHQPQQSGPATPRPLGEAVRSWDP